MAPAAGAELQSGVQRIGEGESIAPLRATAPFGHRFFDAAPALPLSFSPTLLAPALASSCLPASLLLHELAPNTMADHEAQQPAAEKDDFARQAEAMNAPPPPKFVMGLRSIVYGVLVFLLFGLGASLYTSIVLCKSLTILGLSFHSGWRARHRLLCVPEVLSSCFQ